MPDDNNSTPWPPAPKAGVTKLAKEPVNDVAGWISLGLAILAWVVSVVGGRMMYLLVIHGDLAAERLYDLPMGLAIIVIPICAIVFGIKGRRSWPGKLGIVAASANFVLTALAFWGVSPSGQQ